MTVPADPPFDQWQWLQPPARCMLTASTLEITTEARTDFWRQTHDGGVRDDGHFFHRTVSGDFVAIGKVTGQYRDQYDQAGLMARVDQSTWLKCGIEFVDGQQWASVVVTRDWSDWSVVPAGHPVGIWFRLSRRQHTMEVEYSLDNQSFVPLRQCFLTSDPNLQVGVMACAPRGDGLAVRFDEVSIQ